LFAFCAADHVITECDETGQTTRRKEREVSMKLSIFAEMMDKKSATGPVVLSGYRANISW